jgi:hypothetical protein
MRGSSPVTTRVYVQVRSARIAAAACGLDY